MQLVRTVPPTLPVIGLTDAKAYLRVDVSDDDALITALVARATAMLDGRDGTLGRCLAPQTWRLDLARFPCGVLEVPLPPHWRC